MKTNNDQLLAGFNLVAEREDLCGGCRATYRREITLKYRLKSLLDAYSDQPLIGLYTGGYCQIKLGTDPLVSTRREHAQKMNSHDAPQKIPPRCGCFG